MYSFDVCLKVCACTFCPFKGLDYLQCAYSFCILLLGQHTLIFISLFMCLKNDLNWMAVG